MPVPYRRLPLLASAAMLTTSVAAHADIVPQLTAVHRDIGASDPTPTLEEAALITAGPDLRAIGASIIGYYPTGRTCYGGCCNGPECLYATACAGAEFFGPGGAGGTCGQGNTCISYTVKWATDSPTSVFWLGCSVPPNPSVPETLYRTTWQLTTSSTRRPSTQPTLAPPSDGGFTLPPGFTAPTIAPPPTGGLPPGWTTFAPAPFPCQTGFCLGDDPVSTTTKGTTAGSGSGSGSVPGAAPPARAGLLDGTARLLAAGVTVFWGIVVAL
ncbi:hypothetical protein Micbo1qcDRAFT_208105 [Microdochium bolleyi]|uniref:Uncharacterized protein n=1 Tax=Microdochium bolleyi TaxID=196109 RepID=A0A136IRB9_9PEZI|nr:hypothetical protein Micbo1qcDRAFT_208105 [Microdochium bolleyi]